MGDNSYGERIEIIVRDFSGAKIDSFRWSLQDKGTEGKVLNIIRRKYGIFKPYHQDLDWLKKGTGF